MRIVSLLPSATEIVCALGSGDELVGRSHECDHPTWVTELPACTTPKIAIDGTSREIDGEVRDLVEQGLSVYEIDRALLEELEPDVVITQSQCEVCAVSEDEVAEAVRSALGGGTEVVSLAPQRLPGILADLRTVAAALGDELAGRRLADVVGGRLQAVRDAVSDAAQRPTVAMIEWMDPLMVAGNWIPEVVRIAGGEPVLGVAGERSGSVDIGDLADVDPDVIIVAPCGYGIERTVAEMPGFDETPGWSELRAVREGTVYLVDGHHYLNRPGPRIADSTEIVAEILHPDIFSPRYEHEGWRRAG